MAEVGTLRSLHRELIVPHFPEHERGTADELVDAVTSARQLVWAASRGDDWLACPVVECFPGGEVALLTWLAVSSRASSLGLGARLVRVAIDYGEPMVAGEKERNGEKPKGVVGELGPQGVRTRRPAAAPSPAPRPEAADRVRVAHGPSNGANSKRTPRNSRHLEFVG